MSQRIRIYGPVSGAWPEVENGLYTGRHFRLVYMNGIAVEVSKKEWLAARVPDKAAK